MLLGDSGDVKHAVLQDAVNSLMNPDEASVLAPMPIRGATYVAAKLTHLLSLVAIIATAVNLTPAVAGLYLPGSAGIIRYRIS